MYCKHHEIAENDVLHVVKKETVTLYGSTLVLSNALDTYSCRIQVRIPSIKSFIFNDDLKIHCLLD